MFGVLFTEPCVFFPGTRFFSKEKQGDRSMADLSKTVHVYSDGKIIVNTYHPEIHPNEMEKPVELDPTSEEYKAIVSALNLPSLAEAPVIEVPKPVEETAPVKESTGK